MSIEEIIFVLADREAAIAVGAVAVADPVTRGPSSPPPPPPTLTPTFSYRVPPPLASPRSVPLRKRHYPCSFPPPPPRHHGQADA